MSSVQKVKCETESTKDHIWNWVYKRPSVKMSLQKTMCETESTKDQVGNWVYKRPSGKLSLQKTKWETVVNTCMLIAKIKNNGTNVLITWENEVAIFAK